MQNLSNWFGLSFAGSIRETLAERVGEECLVARAAQGTLEKVESSPAFSQTRLGSGPWNAWRRLDGSAFCEMARQFYASLLREILAQEFAPELGAEEMLARHAWEMSRITLAFSARWYNACVRDSIPSRSNIRWYIGHCLGKLDLELERGLSSHDEAMFLSCRKKRQPAEEEPRLPFLS